MAAPSSESPMLLPSQLWPLLWLLAACSQAGNAADPTAGREPHASGGSGATAGSPGNQTGGATAGTSPVGPSLGGGGSGGTTTGNCSDAGEILGRGDALVHPGGLHKQSDLERMRYQVQAGIEPWASAFVELSQHAAASFDYVVRGDASFTLVSRDGENGAAFQSDVNAAYLNALMWGITQDPRHAAKCIEIFNAWKNLTGFTGGGTEPLNAGLLSWKLAEAAEIIKWTDAGWSDADRQQFEAMLVYPGYSNTEVPETLSTNNGTFYWRIFQGDPGRHGNQDLIAWRAMLSMGVLLDQRIMVDRALNYFKGLPHRADDLPYASGPSPSGNQTEDNVYFTAYQYSGSEGTVEDYGYNGVLEHYIWENGQTQEASRDQQHAFFGLSIVAGIAEVAWNQGDGVYNALDDRILKGFEFAGRYNTSFIAPFPDQPEPWEPSGDEVIQRLDRTGRWFTKSINPSFDNDFEQLSRGDFPGKRPVFEQPLAHFQGRMGKDSTQTLWTERSRDVAIEESGYEGIGFSLDHPGWGALSFRRPALAAGDPIRGFAEGLPEFSMHVFPGTIEAEHYDYFPVAGEGHTYHDASPGNSGASYRLDDVDVVCGLDQQYVLTDLEPGEWLSYTVFVPEAASYSLGLRFASNQAETAVGFELGGVDVTGALSLPDTRGEFTTLSVGQFELSPGVQSLRLNIAESAGSVQIDQIVVSKP